VATLASICEALIRIYIRTRMRVVGLLVMQALCLAPSLCPIAEITGRTFSVALQHIDFLF